MSNETNLSSAASDFETVKAHIEDAAEATQSHVKEAVDQTSDQLKSAGDDFRTAAESKANELGKLAAQTYDDSRKRVGVLQEDAESYIRESPTRAILTALGVGFIIGWMLRR